MADGPTCHDCNWPEWSRHVLAELSRLSDNTGKLQNTISVMREDVAGLKVKASVWGGIAGVITALSVLILQWVKGSNQ